MTATEALERRIDELCRENERLRQDNDGLRELKLDRTDNAIRVQARRMGLSRVRQVIDCCRLRTGSTQVSN